MNLRRASCPARSVVLNPHSSRMRCSRVSSSCARQGGEDKNVSNKDSKGGAAGSDTFAHAHASASAAFMAHRLVPVPRSRVLRIHPAQQGWAVGGVVARQAGLEGSIQLCTLRLGEDRLTDLTGWQDVPGTAQAQPQVTTGRIARAGCSPPH